MITEDENEFIIASREFSEIFRQSFSEYNTTMKPYKDAYQAVQKVAKKKLDSGELDWSEYQLSKEPEWELFMKIHDLAWKQFINTTDFAWNKFKEIAWK